MLIVELLTQREVPSEMRYEAHLCESRLDRASLGLSACRRALAESQEVRPLPKTAEMCLRHSFPYSRSIRDVAILVRAVMASFRPWIKRGLHRQKIHLPSIDRWLKTIFKKGETDLFPPGSMVFNSHEPTIYCTQVFALGYSCSSARAPSLCA